MKLDDDLILFVFSGNVAISRNMKEYFVSLEMIVCELAGL